MNVMKKLKMTAEVRGGNIESIEQHLRRRMLEQLDEQQGLADAEIKGEQFVKTQQIYVTNEDGERIAKTVERRLRKWFWRNSDGNWFMELRYGNKAIKLSGENTAVEVGDKGKLTTVIATLTDAVKAGELDKALAVAKKERMAMLRKS